MEFNINIIFKDNTIINDHSYYYCINKNSLKYLSSIDNNSYDFEIFNIFLITISYKMENKEFIAFQFFNTI